jgi:ubiquitin-conjugating enzyme E2 variant
MLTNWNATILGPPHVCLTDDFSSPLAKINAVNEQSVHENRIYSVNIHCGDDYPDRPPTLQFVSKINIPCVDGRTGKV